MAGSSGMVFARVAGRHGLVSRRQLARWGWDHLRYRLRGSTDEQTNEVVEVASTVFADVPEREISRMSAELLAGILPRIYPEMLDEVHLHQDQDRPTFLVSAAGNDLVRTLARVLGMDDGIGTRWEVAAGGAYTGRMDGPFVYGAGKVEAMRRFAEDHGIDLATSYAYSDSASDLPMLQAVGNPVAVNPDQPLLEVARQQGWRVIRFEKLGRRLAIAGATALALAIGGSTRALAARRRQRNRFARMRHR
jgi:HAD superfamily hydrolase (TIGR01490 family)